MDPISMLMAGTSLASGLTSFFGGRSAKKKAEEAARLQYEREKAAAEESRRAGLDFKTDLTGYADAYDPYVATGLQANDAYGRLLQDPSSVRSLPGYQFLQDEGIRGLDASAGAHGMLKSGRGAKDLLRFSQGLADQTYGSQLDRLFRGSQAGMQATGAQTGMLERGSRGALDASLGASRMMYGAAGTEPQGMVAGKQAELKGIEGLVGGIGSAVGQVSGPGGPLRSLMAGTSRGSSFLPTQGTGGWY
jgi:hypothetical protein